MANINLVALAFRLDGRKWNMKIWIPSGRGCKLVSHLPAISFSYKKGKNCLCSAQEELQAAAILKLKPVT